MGKKLSVKQKAVLKRGQAKLARRLARKQKAKNK